MPHVDAHHHLWQAGAPGTEWLDGDGLGPIRRDVTVEETARVFRESQVTTSVLVEARSNLEETTTLLDAAADLARHHATRHAVVGWLDLAGDVAAQLARLSDHPERERLVGIRHQIQGEGDDWFHTPAAGHGLSTALAAGLVFDLVIRPDQLPAVTELAAAHPGGHFVLDHLGKPPIAAGGDALARWRDDLAGIAELDHVAAKLSGLVTEADWAHWTRDDIAPVVEHALECFGPDRLLHGSDWPVCTLAAGHADVVALHRELVPHQHHDAVFRDNAFRVYRLDRLR